MQVATSPKRQDARAVRSRAAMQGALIKLLRDFPLAEVTGAMVSETAGIGYSTFFRHYADVRALLVDAVGELANDLAQKMLPALLDGQAGPAALALIQEIDRRRAEVTALMAGAGEAMRVELAGSIVDRLAALPDISPDWLPQHLALRVAVAATIELCDWWLLEQPATPIAVVADMLDRLVVAPMTAHGTGTI
ncbi:hypothetical protein EDF58_11068 [Novosphingobium sp. PhB57]|uniref:hypothetical protein n=1 Tax=Novosphingobium sp. PhB57 TaxID=2485107 RepID=UPI00104A8FA4|nr:hypothetical protein [Novosphingobium sp. PhB57]TCU53817.1 hypothetical protein EDF58_11068 [Novosphingobium sp. PhB57]